MTAERTQGPHVNVTQYLHQTIPDPCMGRPFVCEGHPESSDVIVVGDNPATTMGRNWWSFWDDRTGFNLLAFEQYYTDARRASGRSDTSNTRLRLRRLRAAPLNCLETNAFSNEGLGGNKSGKSNLPFLRKIIENSEGVVAVVAHGTVAQRTVKRIELPPTVSLFVIRHFSRASYLEVDGLIANLVRLRNTSV